ncbi:MAG: SOS response-associated peptidase [Clostridiales bacterium]|nr:SOS response-associated peptidase [Clostridiales bacterium]
MCGRYEILIRPENSEMAKIFEMIRSRRQSGMQFETGEIFPTNPAPIIADMDNEISAELFIWGFPKYRGSGVIINARKETAAEKSTFKQSLIHRRCVVPSTGFFEWAHDGSNRKYKFNLPGEENLYMAGLWSEYNSERKFVILTAPANESMAEIHNRMPVILPKSAIKPWIEDTSAAMEILNAEQPRLTAVGADGAEQLRLW